MSQARITALPERRSPSDETLSHDDNPARAFANGVMLALPLWVLIGVIVWALI